MKTAQLIGSSFALCAMSAAFTAYAVGIQDGADQFPGFTSAKTAADVRSELVEAKARGLSSVCSRDGDENSLKDFHSTKTHASVRDELKDADAHGLSGRSRIDGDEQNFSMHGSSGTGATGYSR